MPYSVRARAWLIENIDKWTKNKKTYFYFGGCRYILKVPFDNEESSGIVYVWIGSKADPDEARLIQEIAEEMFNNVSISCQVPATFSLERERIIWLLVPIQGHWTGQSRGAQFESRLGHYFSRLGFSWLSSASPGKFQDTTSMKQQLIFSESLQVHKLSRYWQHCWVTPPPTKNVWGTFTE